MGILQELEEIVRLTNNLKELMIDYGIFEEETDMAQEIIKKVDERIEEYDEESEPDFEGMQADTRQSDWDSYPQ